MTDRQQADFERYMHIVPHKIKKYAPDLIGDEDFEQDCYLHLLEYITTNAAVNNIAEQGARGIRISINLTEFVKSHARQWTNEPLLVLVPDNIDPYRQLRQKEIFEDVHTAINELPEIQQTAIRLHFGFSTGTFHSLASVGLHMGKCRESIRQIRNRAFKQLRNPNKSILLKRTFPVEYNIVYKQVRKTPTRWYREPRTIRFRNFDFY